MRLVFFGLMLSSFCFQVQAQVQVIENCAAVESVQNQPGFISMGASTLLGDLTGPNLKWGIAQATKAAAILSANALDLGSDYRYKLTYLGIKFDAINIDMGGNGHTVLFIENETQDVNFGFHDGDLYVNGKRCFNVELPGDEQF